MAWYSVLPAHLTIYETWIIRTFIFLAVINMAPWLSLIIYDFLLYLFRTIYYEIPVVGGRARGEIRPRAPSLADVRPRVSFTEMITTGSAPRSSSGPQASRLRDRVSHTRKASENAVDDEVENT